MRNILMLCLSLSLLSACSVKTSEQLSMDLWKTWEGMDELVQQDYPEQPPVVLIHGWNGGEFTWPAPDRLKELEDQLQRDIYLFNYRTGIVANRYPPLEVLEEKLDRFLFKYPVVDVVAHSMGGLLLRQYLSHHPDNPVRRAVFLSTPHFGTNAARFLTGLASLSAEGNIQASEIRPGSDFLWQLNDLEGSELMGIQTLNVYVGKASLLESDFIVDASSAYLPWANNVQVKGDHHTLAKRLPSFDFIVDFLNNGSLPDLAPVPERRDVWLHFVRHVGDTPEPFTPSSLKRLDARGVNRPAGIATCCDVRAGLYPMGGNVAVIEDLQPDERIEYRSRQAGKLIVLRANDLRRSSVPVQLKTVVLEPGESADSEKAEKRMHPLPGKPSDGTGVPAQQRSIQPGAVNVEEPQSLGTP
ncbi:MAG: alpha/beta fold hydrolase [Mariprofundaceae bacterium]